MGSTQGGTIRVMSNDAGGTPASPAGAAPSLGDAAARQRDRTWTARLIVGGVALIVAVIFAVQNSERVETTFLFWEATTRLWVVIVLSLALGALLGQVVPALVRRRRQ